MMADGKQTGGHGLLAGGGQSGGGGRGSLSTQGGVIPAGASPTHREPVRDGHGAQLSTLSAVGSPQEPVTVGLIRLGNTVPAVNAQALGFGASHITAFGGHAGPGGGSGYGSVSFGFSPGASSSGTDNGFRRHRSNQRRRQVSSVNGNAHRQQASFGRGDPISKRMEAEHVLLERILDRKANPTNLSLALLQSITNDFSEENKIGHGGFGVVYKGVLGERIVAVKRIDMNIYTVDDKSFRREVTSLMNVTHDNVVRFLGFCSNTHGEYIKHLKSEERILVNINERLLCLEYIRNGSLDNRITDELRGFKWETRYNIITGICEGLRYLHQEKNITHMDLKPANILLDGYNMVPRITDFGLSRPHEKTHTTGNRFGTLGYLAPEYSQGSKTTPACDIYSLGIIITELVTGRKGVPHEYIALRRWRHRWRMPPTLLQYQQVTRCIDIAVRCRKEEPKDRPSIEGIMEILNKPMETDGQISPYFNKDAMLDIKPLEIRLPSELTEDISFPVELTNGTSNYIRYEIRVPNLELYNAQPIYGVIKPKSRRDVKIIVKAQDVREQDHVDKLTVYSSEVDLIEGHLNKNITHSECLRNAGTIIDEVDLMVLYVLKKPEENFRSREETNIPAEELLKAEQKKILLSTSGKVKRDGSENAQEASMEVNSSAQQKYNLHPVKSFSRRYPTESKYLAEESDRAVDLARGAMGSLLDKLGKLVMGNYSLDTSIKRDIESFSVHLTNMHRDLPKLQKLGEAKIWVGEVREMSYNIEDMVDSIVVHDEPGSNRSAFKEIIHESVKLLENGMMTSRQIGDVIRDIKNQVQDTVQTQNKYEIDVKNVVVNASTKSTIDDLRISAIYVQKDRLVGIKRPRGDLIKLLQKDGNASTQKLKIISIVGMGGLGKTTLAKAVYDKLQDYNTRSFVSVGQNPDVKTVLKKIIRDCQDPERAAALEHLDQWGLINEIFTFLKDKRYFIVIDDIWDSAAWGLISCAFPAKKRGSIMITTTRIHYVALATCNNVSEYVYKIKPLSDEDSTTLFYRRTFPEKEFPDTLVKEEISRYIMKTCRGMPLAINSIASRLAGEEDTTWENVWKSLGALTEGKTEIKPHIDNMKQILDLSYMFLPDDLKTCLLYVCKYPEDREIYKNDLLRQWVAEGFVSRKGKLDAEDVAENNFTALINMCMIEPGKIDCNNEVLSCRVHDLILDLMRSKSSEVNFIHVINGFKDVSGKLRRVSVQYDDKEDTRILETIKGSVSHARSVSFFRGSHVPRFLEFKYVRVLHLEHVVHSKDPIDLTIISRLFLLRYLKIVFPGSEVTLPDQIGQLQQLETIDLQGNLKNYPSDIVSLPWLTHLVYDGNGIALPDGIGKLKSLCTLEGVFVHKSSVDSLNGLGELTNLRKLQICSRQTYIPPEEYGLLPIRENALYSSISSLSTSLKILGFGNEEYGYVVVLDFTRWSRPLFREGSRIQKLDMLKCGFHRCPEWIGQLHHLNSLSVTVMDVDGVVNIVGGLPSLAYFRLFNCKGDKELMEDSVAISGFQVLKHLIFQSRKTFVTFEAGALPKLEKLELLFRHHMTEEFLPVGIQHLPSTLIEIILTVAEDDTEIDWDTYDLSQMRIQKSAEDYRTERQYKTPVCSMLKKAFKAHHRDADIIICFDEGGFYDNKEYDSNDDTKYDSNDDKEHEEANTHFRNLTIKVQKDFDRMSINTDTPPSLLHLAGGSQSSGTEDLESLQLPSTNLALCSSPASAKPVGNNGLLVQQVKSGMLVNAVGQYRDSSQAPLGGLPCIAPLAAAQPEAKAVDDGPSEYDFWENLLPFGTDSNEGAEDNDDDPCPAAYWDNLLVESDEEGEEAPGQA